MVLHEAKNEHVETNGEFPLEMLALTPLDSCESFSGVGSNTDGYDFPVPLFAFGDSDEDDADDDMEEDSFDDMEEEDFDDDEDDDDFDDDEEDEEFDEEDDEDYDYDEDTEFEYDDE